MLKLREYQKNDALKLAKLKCSACLNQQRTGKTPTALAVMYLQKHKKILIICPSVALYSWKTQFENWLQRPCIVLDGTPKQRLEKLKQWTDGLVITYDTLKLINRVDKNTNKIKKSGELINILNQSIDAVIVDEFHRARNRKTYTAKALFKLIPKIEYRIALTGTPTYAKTEDIWTMLHFLYPDKFKNYWDFITEYFNITFKWTPNGTAREIGAMKPDKEKKLQLFLSKIATQRKQNDADVMPWLPKKPEPIKIKLPALPKQQKHLENLVNYFETENIICMQPLDRLTHYRQICQDPRLLGLKDKGVKTEWLQTLYKDYPDTPTIIFSEFTQYLEMLAKECPKTNALITGHTNNAHRREIEQMFQNGKIQYIFANIKAAKENLTLDRSEMIIFTDKYPPIGDILQASERFTATTEDKKDIPKKIIELVIDKSFEEKIYENLEQQKTTTDILNDFMKY